MKTVTPATFGRVLVYSASLTVALGTGSFVFPGYGVALQLGAATITALTVGWAAMVPLDRTAPKGIITGVHTANRNRRTSNQNEP